MKKVNIISVGLLLCIVIFSCKKNSNNAGGGTWTFKGHTYSANYSNFIQHTFISNTGDNFPTGSLLLDYALPTDSSFSHLPSVQKDSLIPLAGTYSVSRGVSDNMHMSILLSDSSATRTYSPSIYATTVLTVVRIKGKMKVTIPDVMMVSSTDPTDSAVLSGTLTQYP